MAESMSDNSLSGIFSKVKGVLHTAMVFTMGTMALAGVASLWASGLPVGVFDAFGMYLNMHIPSWDDLSMLGTAFEGVVNSGLEGNWVSENFWANPHDLLHGHGTAIGVDVDSGALPLPSDTLNGLGWE